MANKAEWLKLAKSTSKTASTAVVKSLGWMAAAIFCIQKATARAYDSGANNVISKISEAAADELADDNNTESNE